jgi:hypothetical protein
LADYPNLLAGDLIDHDAPRRWLFIRREVAVPSGEENKSLLSLDHLFLDQDAVPTLVPRVYGQTIETQEKSRKGSTTHKQWDEESFFRELAHRSDEQSIEAAQFILKWAKSKTLIWWGKGTRTGSFVPYILHNDVSHPLFAVYTYSKVEIYFYWYAYKPPFDDEAKRLLLLEKLNNIDGVKIPKQAIAKRPSISLHILNTREKIDQFLAIFDWFLDVVKQA